MSESEVEGREREREKASGAQETRRGRNGHRARAVSQSSGGAGERGGDDPISFPVLCLQAPESLHCKIRQRIPFHICDRDLELQFITPAFQLIGNGTKP